ncbi:MAG: hypothetical protein ACFFCT_10730 [Candidatus Odinarchaeota archaeon]
METKTDTEHQARNVVTSTIQSTLLLFFILFPMIFIDSLIHEGAHLLASWSPEVTVYLFYVHPFSMDGFVFVYGFGGFTVWELAAGHVTPVLISLPLFLLLWRRRSIAILPLVMWFPWTIGSSQWFIGFAQGIDDFNHILDITGWPAWPFLIILSILMVVGMVLFVSFFPLLGLDLKDKRTFFVVPGAFLLYGLVSIIVAYLFVPGSPADVQLHMGEQLISSTISGILGVLIIAALFILVYFTLFPIVERRLPATLRTERRNLVWKDLLIPGILCVISIVIGILLIR